MTFADQRLVGEESPEEIAVGRALQFMIDQPDRVFSSDECKEFVAGIKAACDARGVKFSPRFVQAMVETNNGRYGGQVKVEQFNIGGIAATDDGAPGLSNDDWGQAGRVFVAHSLAWANDPRGKESPRWHLVQEKAKHTGFARTFRELGNGRWATDPIYGDTIDRRAAEIVRATMATGKEVTDRHIAAWRQRGIEVVDNRGSLPVNAAHPYRTIALGAIRVIVDHWTGDRFSRAFIQQVTGTDYGLDAISDRMTAQDEVDLVRWYANLHIGNDGRTWGGIAYPYMAFPSGRIHVNWDIGTLTYHAFSVNAYSIAVCCPNSNGQEPTPRQLVALNSIWWALCEETPEIPAGWANLWGHTECKQFDAKNQTICPGPVYLRHVQQARRSQAPTVPIAATPVVDPGMPGVLQADGTPLVGEINFGGQLVQVQRVILQGKNASDEVYNIEWDAHQVAPWAPGAIPLPRRVS